MMVEKRYELRRKRQKKILRLLKISWREQKIFSFSYYKKWIPPQKEVIISINSIKYLKYYLHIRDILLPITMWILFLYLLLTHLEKYVADWQLFPDSSRNVLPDMHTRVVIHGP